MSERNRASVVRTTNCMSCGGQVYFDRVDGRWRHSRTADWLSGGAHKVLLPEINQ